MPVPLVSIPDNPQKMPDEDAVHSSHINQDPELTALLEEAIEAVNNLLSDTSEQDDEAQQDKISSKPKK